MLLCRVPLPEWFCAKRPQGLMLQLTIRQRQDMLPELVPSIIASVFLYHASADMV